MRRTRLVQKYCLTFPADTDPVDSCFALGGEYIQFHTWVVSEILVLPSSAM